MACASRIQERLKAAERPAVLVGPGVLRRADRAAVLHQVCVPCLLTTSAVKHPRRALCRHSSVACDHLCTADSWCFPAVHVLRLLQVNMLTLCYRGEVAV